MRRKTASLVHRVRRSYFAATIINDPPPTTTNFSGRTRFIAMDFPLVFAERNDRRYTFIPSQYFNNSVVIVVVLVVHTVQCYCLPVVNSCITRIITIIIIISSSIVVDVHRLFVMLHKSASFYCHTVHCHIMHSSSRRLKPKWIWTKRTKIDTHVHETIVYNFYAYKVKILLLFGIFHRPENLQHS